MKIYVLILLALQQTSAEMVENLFTVGHHASLQAFTTHSVICLGSSISIESNAKSFNTLTKLSFSYGDLRFDKDIMPPSEIVPPPEQGKFSFYNIHAFFYGTCIVLEKLYMKQKIGFGCRYDMSTLERKKFEATKPQETSVPTFNVSNVTRKSLLLGGILSTNIILNHSICEFTCFIGSVLAGRIHRNITLIFFTQPNSDLSSVTGKDTYLNSTLKFYQKMRPIGSVLVKYKLKVSKTVMLALSLEALMHTVQEGDLINKYFIDPIKIHSRLNTDFPLKTFIKDNKNPMLKYFIMTFEVSLLYIMV